jgi:Ca2+-transporting ATPase
MRISELVDKSLVNAHLRSNSREGVLREIVDALYRHNRIKDKNRVLLALTEREKKGSTGIGSALAIPHARIDDLKEVVLFVGLSRRGIDFSSVDGKPVHLVVLFLTPVTESATHLKILSKLAAVARDRALITELTNARTDEELYNAFKQADSGRERFFTLTKDEIYLELGTSERGLERGEARSRLKEFGPNRLEKKGRKSLLVRFMRNFTNLLAILMLVGSGLSFWANMPEAGWACLVVIAVNAAFSFWQEYKAEKAIDALTKLIPSYARLIREGLETKVPTGDIVPGDIILVEEGDIVPADARLVEAHELRVNNSAFSGESRLAHKMSEGFADRGDFLWLEMPNLIFAGTSIASGTGKAAVIATGMGTEIGRIAHLTQTVKEDLSPLQQEVNRLSKLIAAISIVMGFVFFFVGLAFTKMTLMASAMFAIGIILANVPQGLMPTLTLSLAMAVQRMARRNALIKKLSAVETLGCTNVICTDKTGTITTNQMSVKKIWLNDKLIEVTDGGREAGVSFSSAGNVMTPEALRDDGLELLIRTGALCSTAKLVSSSPHQNYWNVLGDPTEGALLMLAKKAGFDYEQQRGACRVEKRFPFESVRKRMSSVNRLENGRLCAFVKGAPRELLEICDRIFLGRKIVELTAARRAQISSQIDALAAEGLRILGFAYRDISNAEVPVIDVQTVESGLVFIGVTAMYDPPREGVKEAVAVCKKAGIRVIMITGDDQITALSIAKQVGIVSSNSTGVITGNELSALTDEQLKSRLCEKEVVFARVNPEHKLRLVHTLKLLGNIVAVTGDGVNDAPALKRADIGVAMGLRGTDVAKESAEMVLVDDNFASIVAAIEEGRAVFENIKKFITYIFAHLVPEAVPYIFYVILKIPVPITVMQILAIDLGTETLPALALGVEKPEPDIMELPPRPKTKGIVDRLVLFRGYIFLGLLNAAAVLAAYYWVLYRGGWRPGMQLETGDTVFENPLHLKAITMIFAGIVVMQIANIFACRSEKYSAFKMGFLSNRLIIWGIILEVVFVCLIAYVPFLQKIFNTIGIGWKDWGILAVFMITIFFIEELRKKIRKTVSRCRSAATV